MFSQDVGERESIKSFYEFEIIKKERMKQRQIKGERVRDKEKELYISKENDREKEKERD